MELSLFGRPDWGSNKICINHLFETSEDLAWFVKWSSYGVSKRREIFQNIFEIFSIIVSNSKSHTGRCHMIYWCFLIVCLLSFHWKLAPCEHFICRHSQKLQCTPSNIPDSEYWTFQLTSHGQWFLISSCRYTAVHWWSWRSFERLTWQLAGSSFKEFFQICKKH